MNTVVDRTKHCNRNPWRIPSVLNFFTFALSLICFFLRFLHSLPSSFPPLSTFFLHLEHLFFPRLTHFFPFPHFVISAEGHSNGHEKNYIVELKSSKVFYRVFLHECFPTSGFPDPCRMIYLHEIFALFPIEKGFCYPLCMFLL